MVFGETCFSGVVLSMIMRGVPGWFGKGKKPPIFTPARGKNRAAIL